MTEASEMLPIQDTTILHDSRKELITKMTGKIGVWIIFLIVSGISDIYNHLSIRYGTIRDDHLWQHQNQLNIFAPLLLHELYVVARYLWKICVWELKSSLISYPLNTGSCLTSCSKYHHRYPRYPDWSEGSTIPSRSDIELFISNHIQISPKGYIRHVLASALASERDMGFNPPYDNSILWLPEA